MDIKSPPHFRHLVADSPILKSLWRLVVPYVPQLQRLYTRCHGIREGELQPRFMPDQYIPPHNTSHLEVPVSGLPVTMNRDDDGDETFTRHFSCYTLEVKEDGSRLKSLQWLQRRRGPGELRNELR